jgi:hypothetical protein
MLQQGRLGIPLFDMLEVSCFVELAVGFVSAAAAGWMRGQRCS